MTLQEFKAWLEGYSAGFTDGVPNAEQWAAIAEKLRNVEPLRFDPQTIPKGITVYPPTQIWTKPANPYDLPPMYPVVTCLTHQ